MQGSFFEWLEEPRQIILFSLLFILLTIFVTKISKRNRNSPKNLKVYYPRTGHRWLSSDFTLRPSYCNVCEDSLAYGMFCSTCGLCVHDKCVDAGSRSHFCKVMALPGFSAMNHRWVKGNLPLCRKCFICSKPCGTEPRLSDYRCAWCDITVHEHHCYNKVDFICDTGDKKGIIVPPYCIHLKYVGWRERKSFVIDSLRRPDYEDWRPVLVLGNPKSGGNGGANLLRAFRWSLNPVQVIDLSEKSPESGLELCRLLPDVQWLILICGGDGTVAWVLDALDKIKLKKRTHVGILPLGTGNDLARVLGWGSKYVGDEHEVDDVLKDLQNARPVPLDRWKVTIQNLGIFKKMRTRVQYMNNYVSIGCDAQVALNFHRHRESQPTLFTSRMINKLMYFVYGSRDVLEAQCKNLNERVELELDGNTIELPELEGILIFNINSWCGGCQLWNNDDNSTTQSSFNDGYLEVVGLYSALHIAKLQVNLAEPVKLGHAKSIKLTVRNTKRARNVPMQLDGEPWEQGACVITVEHHGQVLMLDASELT